MRRLAAGLALLLAGCVAGPNYKVPPRSVALAPKANAPFAAGHERVFASAPLPDRWWSLYNDPILDRLIAEGLAANADLRVAEANMRRASAVVEEAQSARTLGTSLGGGSTLARPEGTKGSLPGVIGTSVGVTLAYPLDLAGEIRRTIEAAQANRQAVEATRDDVRVQVATAVMRAYAAACSANRTLAANNRVLAVQRQTLDVTRRLQRGGRGTAFDVTRARTAVEQSQAVIPAYLAARQAAAFQVAALLGRPANDFPPEVVACQVPPHLARPIPVGDGSELIRRRPDIRAAERNLAVATANIGVATAELYPQVSLGGSVGLSGPLARLGSGDTFGLSLGPLISWSFPNRRAVRARIAEAGAGSDTAAAQFDATVIEALRQTETALSAYAREVDRDAALQRARSDAALAEDEARRLYRFGRTDFLTLLTAQASLANAEATLASSDAAVLDRQADVFLALGGGWGSEGG